MTDIHRSTGIVEQNEIAAFEKGRMQGEMEAIRRLESEQGAMALKQYPADTSMMNVARPDVVEINRLTWMQRIMAGLGEATAVTYLILTIVWLHEYRGNLGWSNDYSGDNIGNVGMYNTHILTMALGLICLSQAILMYRFLPTNLNPWINRGIYCFFQSCAIICWILSLVGSIRSTPEATFWGVESWCFALAMAISIVHGLWSMVWCLITASPVTYENWAETNNHVTNTHAEHQTPEQKRDHSLANGSGLRTIYAPQPRFINGRDNTLLPQTSANVGAMVPQAPANAPRWAENPNTHAENYFLLPRAKWAVCGFVAMGATFLMHIAVLQHNLAAGRQNWSQGPLAVDEVTGAPVQMDEVGKEAALVGTLGLMILASVCAVAYAAMPPRTTLVKNGILTDTRRSSISHNAAHTHNIV